MEWLDDICLIATNPANPDGLLHQINRLWPIQLNQLNFVDWINKNLSPPTHTHTTLSSSHPSKLLMESINGNWRLFLCNKSSWSGWIIDTLPASFGSLEHFSRQGYDHSCVCVCVPLRVCLYPIWMERDMNEIESDFRAVPVHSSTSFPLSGALSEQFHSHFSTVHDD